MYLPESDERKAVLSYVASNLKGKMTLIAHVGAPSTRDSIELAKHAASLGYDALSAIPPIYFKLPDSAVTKYWSDIMEATPLPFIIYNIPQTTGYTLTPALFEKLLTNKKLSVLRILLCHLWILNASKEWVEKM